MPEIVLHTASILWGQAVNDGRATSSQESLDGDVIIAAYAQVIAQAESDAKVEIATCNYKHIYVHYGLVLNWDDLKMT